MIANPPKSDLFASSLACLLFSCRLNFFWRRSLREIGAGAMRFLVVCDVRRRAENHATTRKLFTLSLWRFDLCEENVGGLRGSLLTPLSKSSRSSSRSSSNSNFFIWLSILCTSTSFSCWTADFAWWSLICPPSIWTVSVSSSISVCIEFILLNIHIWS